MSDMSLERLEQLRGTPVHDSAGEKTGGVETEPVELDVELQRETARVVREPVNEVVSDRELGDEEVDVTLREERPVVEKQTVAKERVGIQKNVETERQTVRDEVRKERVDVDEHPAA